MYKYLGKPFLLGIVLLIWPLLVFAHTVSISHLSVSSKSHRWQLVFHSNGAAQCHVFFLEHPYRLVIDIPHARLNHKFTRAKLINTPIDRIRSSYSPERLRLVLDLDYKVKYRVYHLENQQGFAVDLFGHQENVLAFNWPFAKYKKAQMLPSRQPDNIDALKPVIDNESKKPLRDVIIVIDPGHGGKDPGASGPHGTHEKNVVLQIARDLKAIINSQPGFRAVLTRRGNYYISLRGRLAIARRYKADMFIAIHADAYRYRDAQGASVYALSQRGATSEAARWLAQRENRSELMGGVNLADKNDVLKSVLIDLSQTATIRASLHIGQALLSSLRPITRLHHDKVEQAAFVVLKSPDIPSLLVESGFISNAYEERKLNNSHYQQQVAHALMLGIKNYFSYRPPRNTYLAYWRSHPRSRSSKYIVVAGDTLTGLASRYQITVAELRQLNHLRHSHLIAGQVLIIPTSRAS